MFQQVSIEAAQQLIATKNLVIADVRDAESYDNDHIEGAIHLSVVRLQEFCKEADQEQPILLYCYHGISSQSVAQHLFDKGFKEVYSLKGGLQNGKTDRLPVKSKHSI